jgi:hypothetical protein
MLLENQLMKEDQLKLNFNIQFIEKPQASKIKEEVLKFWSLVSKLLISFAHMLEEEKLDFSVVPESEKLSLFKNLLTMLPNFMVVTLFSPESEKEQEKETIYIMK